jgi:hypothetical protein
VNRVHTRERDLITNPDVLPRIIENTHHERRSSLHDDMTLLGFQHPADAFDARDAVDSQRLFRICPEDRFGNRIDDHERFTRSGAVRSDAIKQVNHAPTDACLEEWRGFGLRVQGHASRVMLEPLQEFGGGMLEDWHDAMLPRDSTRYFLV